MTRLLGVAIAVAVALATPVRAQETLGELSCMGDCDADGVVTVEELLTGVGVVLDRIRPERCVRLESPTVDGLVAAVGNALHGCSNTRARAFREFERFDFLRSAAFGFCPVYGSALAATLLRQEDGRYMLKTTVAERGVEGIDRCLIPGRFGGDCTLGRVRGCRLLSQEESARVADALGAIRVWSTEAPECGVIDPCLHVSLDWDDVRLNDDPCSSDRPLPAEVARIARLLDALTEDQPRGVSAKRSMGECPPGFCQIGDVFLCNDGNDVGGDGCGPNCTDEVAVDCELAEPSELALQQPSLLLRFPVRGRQTVRLGARSFDNAVPVAVRGAEFDPQPARLQGMGCLCLHGDALPALGDGLTGFGVVGCSSAFLSSDVSAVADRDTAPGSAGNSGGLPDDPECDDVAPIIDGVVSRACREGIDPNCGSEVTGRCRSPRQVTIGNGEGGSGAAVVAYNLRLGFLRDNGTCSEEGPDEDGSCRYPDYGPDCLPCTGDDADAAAATLVLTTTGTADATLFDAGPISMPRDIERERDCGGDPCRTTVSGERFDCDLLTSDPARGWASGTLAGAWSDIGTPGLGDSVATLRLRCE